MDNREFEQIDPDNVDEFLRKKMMEAADRYEEELNSDPSLAGLEPSPRVFENIMEMIGKEEESAEGGEMEAEEVETLEAKAEFEGKVEPVSAVPEPESLLSEEDRRALELGRKQLAHPVRCKVLRVLGVAAAVLVGIFGASMTSEANRVKLVNVINVLVGREGVMQLDNEESNEIGNAEEQKAWGEIEEKLGISPIVFMYRPDKMEYEDYELDEITGNVIMIYKYNDTLLYIRMDNRKQNTSQGAIRDGVVINKFEIESDAGNVEVSKVENGEDTNYLAEFQYNNCYYAVYGVMPEIEFVKMIEKIWIN